MKSTIDEVLQKAVNAHKLGHLEEADQLYSFILETHPMHPDANHNMGALSVGSGNVVEALPFLKNAMEANPNIVQYWVSYIDALIRAGAKEEAVTILSKAREKGAKGSVFDQLESRIVNPEKRADVVQVVEKFYKNSKIAIVNNAAQGWVYSALFDKGFIEKETVIAGKNISSADKDDGSAIIVDNNDHFYNAEQVIDVLNKEDNLVKKYRILRELLLNENINLTHDSYRPDANIEIENIQEKIFENEKLNIVIIGAGVTGLFLANTLKNALGNDANILLLDNRSNKENIRKPFDRDWLTHIPSDVVQKYTSGNIKELLECFGTNGQIGLPINMLEALLMLSCKELGVQFYFAPEVDYSKLDNDHIKFFIDATGGRFKGEVYPALDNQNSDLPLQNLVKDFQYTGIVPPNNILRSSSADLNVTLKYDGPYYFPYIENSKIQTPMVKVLGIPENLLKVVYEFIELRNDSNLFFIWEGALKPDFNEGLVFINLTIKEYDLLSNEIGKSIYLNKFLENNSDALSSLNEDIKSFLEMLVTLENGDKIRLDQPFSYSPYINLNAGLGRFNGKPIFPIGDAYFCGNPKVGNGLWTHLGFINELVGQISTAYKKLK